MLAAGLTRNLVAAKETVASTRTIGNMGEAFVYNIMGRGNDGALDRVLNLPTNEAWIDPWVSACCATSGSASSRATGSRRYERGRRPGRAGWVVDGAGDGTGIEADWFVSAMPVEQARALCGRDARAPTRASAAWTGCTPTGWSASSSTCRSGRHHPRPHHLHRLAVGADRADPGPVLGATATSPATTATAVRRLPVGRHLQLGRAGDALRQARQGVLARRRSRSEVLAQIRCHHTAGDQLRRRHLHSWFLDPGIAWDPRDGRNSNDDSAAGQHRRLLERPARRTTRIPNLFLAGDFVQTDIDLATMEGANESAAPPSTRSWTRAGSKAARGRRSSSMTRRSSRRSRRSTPAVRRRPAERARPAASLNGSAWVRRPRAAAATLTGGADLDLGVHLRAHAAVVAGGPAAVLDLDGVGVDGVLPVSPQPVLVEAGVEVVPREHLVVARSLVVYQSRSTPVPAKACSAASSQRSKEKCSLQPSNRPPSRQTCSITAPTRRSPRDSSPSMMPGLPSW